MIKRISLKIKIIIFYTDKSKQIAFFVENSLKYNIDSKKEIWQIIDFNAIIMFNSLIMRIFCTLLSSVSNLKVELNVKLKKFRVKNKILQKL